MISDRAGGEGKIRLLGRRMFIISAAKTVVVLGIVGRLISLQINESKKYKTLSDKNRFREWKFAPPRGIIKDYFGNEIASNRQVYQPKKRKVGRIKLWRRFPRRIEPSGSRVFVFDPKIPFIIIGDRCSRL